MVRDVEGASVVLAKLRALGVRIAIDDFGTGFSSLSHLRHLPVDVLKIDKAFVADIDAAQRKGDNAGGAAIVSAVIGLARGLGLKVVAEGVEKRSQLELPRARRLRRVPGLPPLPAAGRRGTRSAGSRTAASARGASGRAAGYQRIETRAPPSGESLISASPPCHSATLFTIASPRPTPPLSRPRLPSTRVNGSKRRWRSRGGTPGPSSSTLIDGAAVLAGHRERAHASAHSARRCAGCSRARA